jgi:hypothetical protein
MKRDPWRIVVPRVLQHPSRPIKGVLLHHPVVDVYVLAAGGTRLVVPHRWAERQVAEYGRHREEVPCSP